LKTKNEACHYPASLVVYMFIHYAHTIIRLPIIRQVMMMVMMCNNIFHTILLFDATKVNYPFETSKDLSQKVSFSYHFLSLRYKLH
jgi:hypothetical protein